MKPIQTARGIPTTESSNWIAGTVIAGIVLLGSGLTVSTAINGPGVWAAMEQRNAAEIKQEDESFCTRFGMAPGTDSFAVCTYELAEVRRLHSKRLRRAYF